MLSGLLRSPPWSGAVASPQRRALRRLVRRHRRALTAALAGCTLMSALHAAAPGRPVTVVVLVAAHDLSGSEPLAADDLATARLPPADVPAGVLTAAAVLGRTLAGPVRRGEPLTDVRLVGPGLVAALGAGLVATPVRLADAAVASLLRVGDRVDVLAAPADLAGGAVTSALAVDVRVIAVPTPASDDGETSVEDGALVVLATTNPQAIALAAASSGDRLSVTLRAG